MNCIASRDQNSQNRAEPKKKLVFVFYSCYKMLSPPLLAGCFRLPVISASFKHAFQSQGECVFLQDPFSVRGPIVPIPKLRRITKERIITALRSVARKLDHTPSSVELRRLSGISHHQVAWRFGTYRAAVSAAGLLQGRNGLRIEASVSWKTGGTLSANWA
jgi:hypothetical protein